MVWHFQLKVSFKKAEGSQQAGSAGNTSMGVLAPSCDPITPALRGVVAWGITGGLAAHSGHPQKRWDLSGYGRRTKSASPSDLHACVHGSMQTCTHTQIKIQQKERKRDSSAGQGRAEVQSPQMIGTEKQLLWPSQIQIHTQTLIISKF